MADDASSQGVSLLQGAAELIATVGAQLLVPIPMLREIFSNAKRRLD